MECIIFSRYVSPGGGVVTKYVTVCYLGRGVQNDENSYVFPFL